MILPIEDDEATRCALARRLGYIGYHSISTSGGDEALHVLRSPALPHAIVMDWRLRGMNGPDVLRHIRNDRRLADVPVLLYSAYLDDDLDREAMAAGATECVSKGSRDGEEVLLTTLARYAPLPPPHVGS